MHSSKQRIVDFRYLQNGLISTFSFSVLEVVMHGLSCLMKYISPPKGAVVDSLSTGATVGIAVASTAIVVSIVEVLVGVLAYHCICKHRSQQSSKHESSSHQQRQVGQSNPVYEEVPSASGNKIELRDNTAYGPL